MVDTAAVSAERRVRRWPSVLEKLEVLQLTLRPGASVAEVARAHGVNANQVFKWRRAFERGELTEPSTALIPVTVASQQTRAERQEKSRRRREARFTSNFRVEL